MSNMDTVLNNITNEEINKKAEYGVDIYCDECSYKTGFMTFKSAVFKINMQGGYFRYNGQGSSESKCPNCGFDRLKIKN